MKKITITTPQVNVEAKLNDSKTAEAIWDSLPLTGSVQTWGDEIYFGIPVEEKEENPVSEVNVGNLAYWPDGRFFCIFFGKTPISTDSSIIPAGPVNIIGHLVTEPEVLRKVLDGEEIKIDKS